MAKRPISTRTLLAHLARQVGFLDRSSSAFDQGEVDEALRLATSIRVLVHDTRQSNSLLGQLKAKTAMRFWDTARYESDIADAINQFEEQLARDSGGGKVLSDIPPGILIPSAPMQTWVAPLDQAPGVWRRFGWWWNTPIMRSTDGHRFTRKDLVLIMANQDGGAHVDSTIDEHYADLEGEYFGLQFARGWGGLPEVEIDLDLRGAPFRPAVGYIAAHCVRQIAEELTYAIRSRWPDVAPEGWAPPTPVSDTARHQWLLHQGSPLMPVVTGPPSAGS
ncbi:hypothetical protein [Prescottella equi]|uniref:hypothetical protein n=1 Tax=Rhodococcus hoagii TaxID=43767 RepID=UPI00111BEEEE|nr:hypothetical protein [Prescottella equi]